MHRYRSAEKGSSAKITSRFAAAHDEKNASAISASRLARKPELFRTCDVARTGFANFFVTNPQSQTSRAIFWVTKSPTRRFQKRKIRRILPYLGVAFKSLFDRPPTGPPASSAGWPDFC